MLQIFNFSCTLDKERVNKIEVSKTQSAEIKSNYSISWIDNNQVKVSIKNHLSYIDKSVKFDSVILVHYWGYLLEKSWKSYFPINETGQWISTIMKSKRLNEKEVYFIDSLLANPNTYDLSVYHPNLFPKFALAYFKNGQVIGQTAIGAESVKSTILLGSKNYFAQFDSQQHKILNRIILKALGMF